MIVGVYRNDMRLELRDQKGKFLGEILGDDKTLAEMGVREGSVVHVVDITGNSPAFHPSDCEKYVIPDEKYAQREKSVRKWKEKLGVGDTGPGPHGSNSDESAVLAEIQVLEYFFTNTNIPIIILLCRLKY
jgi:hypothetical protein